MKLDRYPLYGRKRALWGRIGAFLAALAVWCMRRQERAIRKRAGRNLIRLRGREWRRDFVGPSPE